LGKCEARDYNAYQLFSDSSHVSVTELQKLMKFDTQRLFVALKYGPHDRQLVAVTIYAAPPCHRDPRRQAGKLLLFPPGPPDGHAQSL
jgi:hypothetical protein